MKKYENVGLTLWDNKKLWHCEIIKNYVIPEENYFELRWDEIRTHNLSTWVEITNRWTRLTPSLVCEIDHILKHLMCLYSAVQSIHNWYLTFPKLIMKIWYFAWYLQRKTLAMLFRKTYQIRFCSKFTMFSEINK